MRVLVCGGRDYTDKVRIATVLGALHLEHHFTHLIHGAAPGADTLAGLWALLERIPVTHYRAEWKRLGRGAGHARNLRMADAKPDLVIAFPGGEGTANMVTIARNRGIPVHIVEP